MANTERGGSSQQAAELSGKRSGAPEEELRPGVCATIVWFWCGEKVGQSSREVPDLPRLTDTPTERVIGSRRNQPPASPWAQGSEPLW